jgi:Ala-tRNA(Pro) deacylase
MGKIGQDIVYQTLESLQITYKYYESPKDFSSEDDGSFWQRIGATRCKNLFLRNHKGNRHFMLIAPYYTDISITTLEQHFKKGKISFASPERMKRWLGMSPGAVSVFSLFNDTTNHVEVFVEESIALCTQLTFLPNTKNAIIAISLQDFEILLNKSNNAWSYFNLKP